MAGFPFPRIKASGAKVAGQRARSGIVDEWGLWCVTWSREGWNWRRGDRMVGPKVITAPLVDQSGHTGPAEFVMDGPDCENGWVEVVGHLFWEPRADNPRLADCVTLRDYEA